MKHLLKISFDWLKPLWDWDTAKVLGAATGGLISSITLDGILHTIISFLTIWYLCIKIRQIHRDKKDEDL